MSGTLGVGSDRRPLAPRGTQTGRHCKPCPSLQEDLTGSGHKPLLGHCTKESADTLKGPGSKR